MENDNADKIFVTPSFYAKEHYLYVQDIGESTSLHPLVSHRKNIHSFLFLIVTAGYGTISYKSRTWEMHQGDCAWLDCSLPISYTSSVSTPWEIKWVHFYGKDAFSFYTQFVTQGSPCIFTPGNPAVFNECLFHLFTLHKRNDPYKELLSHKYLTDLCAFCFPESKSRLPGTHSTQDKLIRIREYILSHYTEKISLDELSKTFFISKYHLVREYRKSFAVTPGSDLIACRISHAKSLLRSGTQNIEEISVLCGFHTSAYFIRMFKKAENMTPLEYRKKW